MCKKSILMQTYRRWFSAMPRGTSVVKCQQSNYFLCLQVHNQACLVLARHWEALQLQADQASHRACHRSWQVPTLVPSVWERLKAAAEAAEVKLQLGDGIDDHAGCLLWHCALSVADYKPQIWCMKSSET